MKESELTTDQVRDVESNISSRDPSKAVTTMRKIGNNSGKIAGSLCLGSVAIIGAMLYSELQGGFNDEDSNVLFVAGSLAFSGLLTTGACVFGVVKCCFFGTAKAVQSLQEPAIPNTEVSPLIEKKTSIN